MQEAWMAVKFARAFYTVNIE